MVNENLKKSLNCMKEAVNNARIELDHIGTAECFCDQSVGLTCEACSANVASNNLHKAFLKLQEAVEENAEN